jgi:hypothetical protein
MWNVLPTPPGFPDNETTLDLSAEEAAWLKERILSGSRGTLFEQLLLTDVELFDSPGPWTVPTDQPEIRRTLGHAQRFSGAMHGAALTYNLALAQHYEAAGHTRVEEPLDLYREKVDSYHRGNEPLIDELAAWDLTDMWALVATANPRVHKSTISFVENWVALIAQGQRLDSDKAITLVCARERLQKRGQSRLENRKLLENWSGRSGTRPFDYRWGNVIQTVTDIRSGLAGASS